MKISQFVESTTAGSIASVPVAQGKTQTRNQGIYPDAKGGTMFKGKKTSKPFANSIAEDSKPNPYSNSLIWDPEERSRIHDLKALMGTFGSTAQSLRRARMLYNKGMLKATPKEVALLLRLTDSSGTIKPRTSEPDLAEGSMNPQELGYDHGNRYDSKNRNPFPKGSAQHQAYEQGHEEGKSDWWEQDQQGVAEGFDSAAFDRHMDKLRAQKELEKTDPMRALVSKMHSDDAHAAKLKRKPNPDDERQIIDPFHSSQGVNIGEQGVAEARGMASVNPYVELMQSLGWFMSMNTATIQQDAVDSAAQQELKTMQQQFNKPIINGKKFADVVSDPVMFKHPKVAPALLKFAYDILGYIEPRIKKYVRPELQSKWMGSLSKLKDQYRAAVQFTSGQQGVAEASNPDEFVQQLKKGPWANPKIATDPAIQKLQKGPWANPKIATDPAIQKLQKGKWAQPKKSDTGTGPFSKNIAKHAREAGRVMAQSIPIPASIARAWNQSYYDDMYKQYWLEGWKEGRKQKAGFNQRQAASRGYEYYPPGEDDDSGMKVSEQGVSEGWKEKVAGAALGAAALGGIGAGIANSPMAHINGQQVPMALSSSIPSDAKLVTDDSGKKIYVWKAAGHKGRPMQVYRPANKDVKEQGMAEGKLGNAAALAAAISLGGAMGYKHATKDPNAEPTKASQAFKTAPQRSYDAGKKLKDRMSGINEQDVAEENDPCWKKYKKVGMKDKNGKQVPNCVLKKGVSEAEIRENDIVLTPGKGSKLKPGLHGKDRKASPLSKFRPPFKASGLWVSDSRGTSVLECVSQDLAPHVAAALNMHVKMDESQARLKETGPTPLRDKADYFAKRSALQRIQMDPKLRSNTPANKQMIAALVKRKIELDNAARAAGYVDESMNEQQLDEMIANIPASSILSGIRSSNVSR